MTKVAHLLLIAPCMAAATPSADIRKVLVDRTDGRHWSVGTDTPARRIE